MYHDSRKYRGFCLFVLSVLLVQVKILQRKWRAAPFNCLRATHTRNQRNQRTVSICPLTSSLERKPAALCRRQSNRQPMCRSSGGRQATNGGGRSVCIGSCAAAGCLPGGRR